LLTVVRSVSPVSRFHASRTASFTFSHVLCPRYSYVSQSRDRFDYTSSHDRPL
jgi:hypothetical protein